MAKARQCVRLLHETPLGPAFVTLGPHGQVGSGSWGSGPRHWNESASWSSCDLIVVTAIRAPRVCVTRLVPSCLVNHHYPWLEAVYTGERAKLL
jgi:hypothetical protein